MHVDLDVLHGVRNGVGCNVSWHSGVLSFQRSLGSGELEGDVYEMQWESTCVEMGSSSPVSSEDMQQSIRLYYLSLGACGHEGWDTASFCAAAVGNRLFAAGPSTRFGPGEAKGGSLRLRHKVILFATGPVVLYRVEALRRVFEASPTRGGREP